VSKQFSPVSTVPTPHAADEDAARLQAAVTRLTRRLRREAGAPLTPSQLSVMATIERRGPLTLGALAECERVSPPTITRMVTKLESTGLVERRPDPEDRRVARVVATPEGRDLLAASRERKVAWLNEGLDQLTPDDRSAVLAALSALEALADGP